VRVNAAAEADPLTMKSQLQALQFEDPAHVFIVRRLSKLGYSSSEALYLHFSQYGDVKRVHVSHSRAKSMRLVSQRPSQSVQWRSRAAALGFIVMADSEATRRIIEDGPEHEVNGVTVSVHPFRRLTSASPPIAELQGPCDAVSVGGSLQAAELEEAEVSRWQGRMCSSGLLPEDAQQLMQMCQFHRWQGQLAQRQQQPQIQAHDAVAASSPAPALQRELQPRQPPAHPSDQEYLQKQYHIRRSDRQQQQQQQHEQQTSFAPPPVRRELQQIQQRAIEQQLRRLEQQQRDIAVRIEQLKAERQPGMEAGLAGGAPSGGGGGGAPPFLCERSLFLSECPPNFTSFMYVSTQDLQNALPIVYED